MMPIEQQREESRRRNSEAYKRRQSLGICCQCKKPAWRRGSVFCQKHRLQYNHELRKKRKLLGAGSPANLYTRRLRFAVISAYGKQCSCCGEANWEFLTIDHVNGRRRSADGGLFGHYLYRWLRDRKYPRGYRLLCINCNFSYGHWGYCPHKNGERIVLTSSVVSAPGSLLTPSTTSVRTNG